MPCGGNTSQDSLFRCPIDDPDALDQFPGEEALYEELGLLAVFARMPVQSSDCLPIQAVKTLRIAPVIEEIRPCVGISKRPALLLSSGPIDSSGEIGFKVDDLLLASGISKIWVVAFVNDVEHYGPWTEVEGDTISYMQIRMTREGEFLEPALFDLVYPDGGAVELSSYALSVAPQAPIGNNGC